MSWDHRCTLAAADKSVTVGSKPVLCFLPRHGEGCSPFPVVCVHPASFASRQHKGRDNVISDLCVCKLQRLCIASTLRNHPNWSVLVSNQLTGCRCQVYIWDLNRVTGWVQPFRPRAQSHVRRCLQEDSIPSCLAPTALQGFSASRVWNNLWSVLFQVHRISQQKRCL